MKQIFLLTQRNVCFTSLENMATRRMSTTVDNPLMITQMWTYQQILEEPQHLCAVKKKSRFSRWHVPLLGYYLGPTFH